MRSGVIIFLMLSVFLTFETSNGDSQILIEMSSLNQSLIQFLKYAAKIKSISMYPPSQRNKALSKFMEIHDELLNIYMLAKNDESELKIAVLLKYLEMNVQKSVLAGASFQARVPPAIEA